MSVRNKTFKFFMLLLIHVVTLISTALLGLLFASPLFSIAVCIADFFDIIPAWLKGNYWLAYCALSVPLTLIFFNIVEKGLIYREYLWIKLMRKNKGSK